ncbi:MAG: divergent polysaccharide deacetylase family protein [Thermoanaerobaculales bacterium]|jgi:polysaccharide deacetylase 2 family uncharacterized protein YibQ|nr:divergent polysaccharide deacetylase family protein [Thermoanaerobaculales bacterium]
MAKRTKRKTSRKKTAAWWQSPLLWIGVSAALLILALWWVVTPGGEAPPALGEGVDVVLRSMAEHHGVTGDDLEVDAEIRKIDDIFVRTWRLRFPNVAAREEFIAEASILGDHEDVVVAAPESRVGRVVGLRIDHRVEAFDLELRVARHAVAQAAPQPSAVPTRRPAPTRTPRPTLSPDARGRLAILLDDAGQRMDLVERASELPPQVGIAILPFLPYSAETAVALHGADHEIWLHLPMEAVGGEDPGPGALTTEMSDDELHDAVFMAINNVPHVVGVNNHMGSKATADLRMMTWVMQDLASMGLAFLDSRTTVATVAEEAARAQGVATGRRHVFLDNERTAEAVEAQLEEAIYRSKMDGEIIAIGHLNEVTIGVLARELSGLASRGVTLVRPTELLD